MEHVLWEVRTRSLLKDCVAELIEVVCQLKHVEAIQVCWDLLARVVVIVECSWYPTANFNV